MENYVQEYNSPFPPLNFHPPLSGKAPPLIQKFFKPRFEILAWISNPPFRKGGAHYVVCSIFKEFFR